MKHYPLPKKYQFSNDQDSGTFLENRKDRVHCGVDLYAPRNTPVYAVDDGIIQSISEFTTPKQNDYWNKTFEIILYDELKYYYRYAELDSVLVNKNERVSAGQRIGLVGQVLNPNQPHHDQPEYIKRLIKKDRVSMLHFEMYDCLPGHSDKYLGGNWFGENEPKGLLDPRSFLDSV